jgi:hypothetical protein
MPSGHNTLTFKLCSSSQRSGAHDYKLFIGEREQPSRIQRVWAYVYARPGSPDVKNQVAYYNDDNTEVKAEALGNVNLVYPFNSITGTERKDRIRYLVLFYFLKKKHLEVI